MKFPIYQVDAFAKELFTGNPAAVVILKDWIDDNLMQKIAFENNLAETAFLVSNDNHYEIRWFTPKVEVDLCGHATLASAYILFKFYNIQSNTIEFKSSRSGTLFVKEMDNLLELDFPLDKIEKSNEIACADLLIGLEAEPLEYYKGKSDSLLVYRNQTEIENLKPDFKYLSTAQGRGIIATAPGDKVDYVYRYFAPQSGIDEDPATGSAQTSLLPYWNEKTGKTKFDSLQLSHRVGYFGCSIENNRAKIAGQAHLFFQGEIHM